MTVSLTNGRGVGFHVVGLPAPQGSKRAVGRNAAGRTLLVESSKKVAPWRQDVTAAAVDARTADSPLDGPLALVVTFTMPRPKSAPKARIWPDRTPDLSKLVRSTEDAITAAGLWTDDARVVVTVATKVYAGHHLALPIPGAVVGIAGVGYAWPWGDATTAYGVALTRALATLTPKEPA